MSDSWRPKSSSITLELALHPPFDECKKLLSHSLRVRRVKATLTMVAAPSLIVEPTAMRADCTEPRRTGQAKS
jgi:hypothetical protein